MLNIKEVIQQLEEEDFEKICSAMEAVKVGKHLMALKLYRENQLSEPAMPERLGISTMAFYVLKSRLYGKIQEHLLRKLSAPKTDILMKIVSIPTLLFNTNRDIATSILTKLEKDLAGYDMPNELTTVYSALKKLYLNTDKYYKYSQLYNSHVAYSLAIVKAEGLLADSVSKLGQYCVSRDKSLLSHISVMKDEMTSVSRLYSGHHLTLYKNILDASIAILLPLEALVADDDPVEDILDRMENTLSAYPKDITYQYLRNVVNFLAFEYYHKLNIPKKESGYFDMVNNNLSAFMLYNHSCFCSKFLISKIERYVQLGTADMLYEENKELFNDYQPDADDIPNYINYFKYLAASAFYAGKYNESAKLLTKLLNNISLNGSAHSEIEVKLFLSLLYSFCNKYDMAWNTLRNTQRKILELSKELPVKQPGDAYENAVTFAAMLKKSISHGSKNLDGTLMQLKTRFEHQNHGRCRMLEFLKMDEGFIRQLARKVK